MHKPAIGTGFPIKTCMHFSDCSEEGHNSALLRPLTIPFVRLLQEPGNVFLFILLTKMHEIHVAALR